jgi:hypothetical protein
LATATWNSSSLALNKLSSARACSRIQFKQVPCFLRVPAKFWPRLACAESLHPDAVRTYLDPNIGPYHLCTHAHDRSSAHVLFLSMFRMQVPGLLLLSTVICPGITKARLKGRLTSTT